MLDWFDNLSTMVIFTHTVAAMVGGCVGVLVSALCVMARRGEVEDDY